jgi:hypothetical protein
MPNTGNMRIIDALHKRLFNAEMRLKVAEEKSALLETIVIKQHKNIIELQVLIAQYEKLTDGMLVQITMAQSKPEVMN